MTVNLISDSPKKEGSESGIVEDSKPASSKKPEVSIIDLTESDDEVRAIPFNKPMEGESMKNWHNILEIPYTTKWELPIDGSINYWCFNL